MNFNTFQNKKTLNNAKQAGWKLYTLTDLLKDDSRNSLKIKKRDYIEEGSTPIVDQGKELIGGYSNIEDGFYKGNSYIVFGDHTRILKYIDFPAFIGADGVKILKNINEDVAITKYLYYFLRTVSIPDTGYNRHFKFLKEVIIPVPKIDVQIEIVNLLDKAINVINKRQQQIDALSALKQSIFLDMFGDPLKNKEEKFEDVIIELRYGTSTPPVFSEKGYKFIRATNIKLGQISEDNMLFISEEAANKIEKCKLELGDLIFVRSGVNSGDNAIVTEEYVGHYGAYDIIVKLNQKVVNPYYLNTLFNSHYLDFIIKPLTRRAGQPHINAKQIKSLKLFVPPIDLQKQYEIKVKSIIQQINKLNESQKELTLLYDSLLYKAYNGELFKEDTKV